MQEHVTINLPTGWLVPDIPQAQKLDLKAATYSLMAENNKSSLHVKRQLVLSLGTVDVKYYPTLRSFPARQDGRRATSHRVNRHGPQP